MGDAEIEIIKIIIIKLSQSMSYQLEEETVV